MDTNIENSQNEPLISAPAQGLRKLIISLVVISFLAGAGGGFLGFWVASQRGLVAPGTNGTTVNQRVVLAEESAIVDVVKKASPAVVSIVVTKDLQQIPGFGLNPFAPFFGFGQPTPSQPNPQQVGAGSGFFVSKDGLIVTNKHVVSDESASYTVVTNEGEQYEAKVLARDPVNDLAIIKADLQNAPTLELADSANLEIGQRVIAIGNSLGQYQNTVTTGVISGIGRSITAGGAGAQAEHLEGVIQTDAAINPGNSGGPLLNILGQVIGVNTAVDQEGQLVGFAIPANDARKALDSFNKNGKIVRPFLGVRYMMVTKALAEAQKLPRDYGALIIRGNSITDFAVLPGSPANKAGLQENDIILECDNKRLDEDNTLSSCIKNRSVGEQLTLKVYSQGQEKTVTVTLEESK